MQENDAITVGAKLIKMTGEASASAKSATEANKRATDAKNALAELEKGHRREKTELATAHERAMQLLREMHLLDKNNLVTELTNTKATLASCHLELAQTKKLLETARSEELKFLQDLVGG